MHPLSLQLKRAHLKSVAFGKQIVERVTDMTPAGFDILYCIRTDFGNRPIPKGQYDYGHGGVRQRDLWKQLGLHHTTISKALKRLRELGWVESGVDNRDARINFVRLTDTGKRRIERAMRIVFQQHSHLKKFEAFFKQQRPNNVVATIDEYWNRLRALGAHLGDTSSLIYKVDYEDDPRLPDYLAVYERGDRHLSRRMDDRTTHKALRECADVADPYLVCGKRSGPPLRSLKSRRLSRRCLSFFPVGMARPESRTCILVLSLCRIDLGQVSRTQERRSREALQGFGPKKIDGMEEWQKAWYQGIVPRDEWGDEEDEWYDDDED